MLRLRLRQLYDLAAAFHLNVPKDLTKAELLPTMIAAEQRGVFRQVQNADQALLRRAGWAHGEGRYPAEEIEQLEARESGPVTGVLHHGNSKPGLRKGLQEFQELQRMVKEIDPEKNTYGMNKEELRKFVRDSIGESDDC